MTEILQLSPDTGKPKYYDRDLRRIHPENIGGFSPSPRILGVGDVILPVPDLEQRVELPSPHNGFYLAEVHGGDNEFVYQISSPEGPIRQVEIPATYTTLEDTDTSDWVTSVAYLGIGGLAFLTDNLTLTLLFGSSFRHERTFDTGSSSYSARGYLHNDNVLKYVGSFQSPGGSKYLMVSEPGSTILIDADIGKGIEEERATGLLETISGAYQDLIPAKVEDRLLFLKKRRGGVAFYELGWAPHGTLGKGSFRAGKYKMSWRDTTPSLSLKRVRRVLFLRGPGSISVKTLRSQ